MERIDDFTLTSEQAALPSLGMSKKAKINAALGFGDMDVDSSSENKGKKRPPKAKIFQDDQERVDLDNAFDPLTG